MGVFSDKTSPAYRTFADAPCFMLGIGFPLKLWKERRYKLDNTSTIKHHHTSTINTYFIYGIREKMNFFVFRHVAIDLRLGPYIPGIKTECNIAHSASNHLTDR
jgi:hypothetical protein